MLLRRMVDNIAGSDDMRALKRYPTLKRELVTAAYRALGECWAVLRGAALLLCCGRRPTSLAVTLAGVSADVAHQASLQMFFCLY